MGIDEVACRFGTSVDYDHPEKSHGLCLDQVSEAYIRDGLNSISPTEKISWVLQFFCHLMGLFNVLLITSGVLSLILYVIDRKVRINLFLSIVLLAVAFLNAAIDFYQQYHTAALLESFLVSIRLTSTSIKYNTNLAASNSIQPFDCTRLFEFI